MINKSVLIKTITAACATSMMVGAFAYNIIRIEEPKRLDLSAFKNATANIQFITRETENKANAAILDVTGSIVNTIEKEVKAKILRTRYSLRPAKSKVVNESKVIAKNWNDNKPVFDAVKLELNTVELKAVSSNDESLLSSFEINNNELIKHYGFAVESLRYESFANTLIVGVEEGIKKDAKVDVIVNKVSELATKENAINDKLEVYDYSEKSPEMVAQVSTQKKKTRVTPKLQIDEETLDYESFANTRIVATEEDTKEDIKEDVVQVAQASTTTQLVEEITPEEVTANEASELATKENAINDELVVYDYSEKAPAVAAENPAKFKKIFDAPISNTVKDAIEREVHKSPDMTAKVATQKKKMISAPKFEINEIEVDQDILDKAMKLEDNEKDKIVYDYSKRSQAAVAKEEETAEKTIAAFTSGLEPDTTTQAEFTIAAREINLNTLKTRQVYGYEFVPDYDRAERLDDDGGGEIKLGYSLSGDVNTQTGVITSLGLIPTRVELNLLNKGMNIPLFSEEGIQRFLAKKETAVTGNLLMVAVDPSIFDVEIDSEHQYKLFFSKNFKLLESQTNAAYVLFLGVRTGNVSIRYLLSNKESAQKIVYVGDGEMYYEDPDFVNTQREIYTFTTRSLLGKKVKELNINASDISVWGTQATSKKKALSAYEIKVPELVENSRKYLEFKHLGNSLLVGTSSATEIEIPGKDFIGKVLETNDLADLGNRCMVQINLTKDLRDIKANGKNKQGEMFVETSFLDNDGNFSRDNSELSEKVFLSGDMEGIFNVRLDYTDGTTDFLKTYCSEGSYIVEQL